MSTKDNGFNNSLESVNDYIKQFERVRKDFVANVSHELRTPLTVLLGYLETLLENDLDETKPWKKIFTQMYKHAQRMSDTIKDLLFLAHVEGDDFPSDEMRLHIAEVLKPLYVEAKEFSGNKNHNIVLDAEPDLYLNGSERELKSLFANIIINAVKYTPENGNIHIQWTAVDNGQAIFKVTDTGYGIAQKHIPRITERFFRAGQSRSHESDGAGLGLAIVKNILLRHQGQLHIESVLGKGSTFTCVFPKERVFVFKPDFNL